MERLFQRYLVPVAVSLLLLLLPALNMKPAQARVPSLIGVLISQELKPFIEMVEGLEDHYPEKVIRIFLDRQARPYSHDARFKPLTQEYYDFIVAADPQALVYLVQNPSGAPQAYGMVLNPERVGVTPHNFCGVSLNIPVLEQLIAIKQVFPDVNRLGVLFNPKHNQPWFETAQLAAATVGLDMVALTVTVGADMGRLFQSLEKAVDALLFIPDQTVISQTIIEHGIRTAFLKGVPVIGYNRFFHESGAALSFVIEPYQVGMALGRLLDAWLNLNTCRSAGPPYRILLNQNVLHNLKIHPTGELPPNVELD